MTVMVDWALLRELMNCVKEEVDVMGSLSIIVCTVSVDVVVVVVIGF